jgi:hypothetical protein
VGSNCSLVWEDWHNGPSDVAGKYVTWDGTWSAATAPFQGFRLYNLMLTASATERQRPAHRRQFCITIHYIHPLVDLRTRPPKDLEV